MERQTGKGLRRSFGPTPAQGMGEARQSEMVSLLSTTMLPRQVQSKGSSSSSVWKDNGENENSVKRLDGAGRSKALKNHLSNSVCSSKSARAVMSTLSRSSCHK